MTDPYHLNYFVGETPYNFPLVIVPNAREYHHTKNKFVHELFGLRPQGVASGFHSLLFIPPPILSSQQLKKARKHSPETF